MPFTIPETEQLRWHDITPKMAAAYDLFGDGKTAVKVSLNKYLNGPAGRSVWATPSPGNLILETTRTGPTRTATSLPDCDLLNAVPPTASARRWPTRTSARSPAAAEVGSADAAGLGRPRLQLGVLGGRAARGHCRGSRSISAYFRRWFGNLTVTDDRALSPADFDTFSIPAPTDSELPDGGGYTWADLRNLKPTSFGRPSDNYVTFADEYGKQIQRWNGVDV